jgi:hypothetical protein
MDVDRGFLAAETLKPTRSASRITEAARGIHGGKRKKQRRDPQPRHGLPPSPRGRDRDRNRNRSRNPTFDAGLGHSRHEHGP